MAQRNGTGMFPREVMNRFPLLPLEEEGRLNDIPYWGDLADEYGTESWAPVRQVARCLVYL